MYQKDLIILGKEYRIKIHYQKNMYKVVISEKINSNSFFQFRNYKDVFIEFFPEEGHKGFYEEMKDITVGKFVEKVVGENNG